MFIMVVMDYLMGRKIKHYSLMMNLAKRFKIPNGVVFFLIIQGTNVVKKQGAMFGPCILFVATFCWIAIDQSSSSSL